jgi:hypothetical protein
MLRSFALVLLVAAALVAAAAAETPAQRYAETQLKTAFGAWLKKNLPGGKVGKVTCVLPTDPNGKVAHCTVYVSAPKYRENVVFKVTNTIHANGTASFAMTSHSCTDSKSGKKLAC